MGGGSWSQDDYTTATTSRRTRGVKDFGYSADVKAGKAVGIHKSLDPKKVAGPGSLVEGQPIRESRDSDEHPESLPVAIIFDVTGSMGGIPRVLQKKLVELMNVINDKTKLTDVQILVGAVGDSYSDKYPFQVGQFESDNRFDEQLRNIILEGYGGGQSKESYGLAYRFAAYHTAIDSYEKRGKKGYFFTMGDENFWPTITKEEVERMFGVTSEVDESVSDLVSKASEMWDIYHLFCMDGSYPDRTDIHDAWKALLGERFIKIDDSSLVCEIIAGVIQMMETSYDMDTIMDNIGVTGVDAASVKNALVPISATRSISKKATGNLPTAHSDSDEGMSRI